MKQGWNKLLASALVCALLVMLPLLAGWTQAQAAGAYGKVTANQVMVRKQPSTSANYWFKVDAGFVCEILDVMKENDITWYKVNSGHPQGNGRTYIGYIHSSYFAPMTAEEVSQWEAGQWSGVSTTTPVMTPGLTTGGGSGSGLIDAVLVGAVGVVTSGATNFRQTENGPVLAKLGAGTEVELLSIPLGTTSEYWYRARYDGKVGYIQAPFIRVKNYGSYEIPDTRIMGHVKLTKAPANLRETAGGQILTTWNNKGETLPYTSYEVKGYYTWYQVVYQRAAYYVRGDCVVTVSEGGSTVPSPSPTPSINPAPSYVATTSDGVNLRLQPNGEVIMQLSRGTVMPCMQMVNQNGVNWYYVQYGAVRGYLHGDHVRACTIDGSTLTPVPTGTPAPTVPATYYGYVKMTSTGVNVRVTPGGKSQMQLARGTIVPVIGPMVSSGRYDWYPIRTENGITGYVRSDCVSVLSYSGDIPTGTPGISTTPGTSTSTPTPPSIVSQYGYIQLTKDSVNLRGSMGGTSLTQLSKGSIWPLTGNIQYKNNVGWYPVYASGRYGYIREDCAYKLSREQEEAYLQGGAIPTGMPTGTPGPTTPTYHYLMTNTNAVNLRAAASKDSKVYFNVPQGTVMVWNAQDTVGGITWYRVVYQNTEVWVMGRYTTLMTQAEYEAWQALHPENTPQTEARVGYVKTIASGVNLRATANGSTILARVDKGVVLPYLTAPMVVDGVTWYYVSLIGGVRGYLHGNYVTVCDANGNDLDNPDEGKEEASYTTLRKGSQGDAVKRLVTALKEQGYYTGAITSSFTSEVESAVKAFQRAKGLTADGVAGADTQHALFNTVPEGSGSGDLTMVIYPAEKIDWFTGGIQQLWAKGENYKIYDVKTGIVWWAHRWSGGKHADIEPLTAADTARLCKIYGVNNAQEIADKNLWQRRPCLVTIGNRTFACSLFGMPHNPDGDTIPNNDMVGQICLHFTNSRTHETDRVDSLHQEAIEYAWKNAPNGYK